MSELTRDFAKTAEERTLWQPEDKLLLAVSGGVDSMALLDAFLRLPDALRPEFAVAHVNHGLRQAAVEEERYLKTYCRERGLSFFSAFWEEGRTIVSNVEHEARQFRYAFFAEVMAEKGYRVLATAHHGDDQIETVLMRLAKGSELQSLTGIRQLRPFDGGVIIRPFLHLPKQVIVDYAKSRRLVYFEDETNQGDAFLRNRLRRQVVPVLKDENPQLYQHITYFAAQLDAVLATAQRALFPLYQSSVQRLEDGWAIALPAIVSADVQTQRVLLDMFWTACFEEEQLVVSLKQRQQVVELLNQDSAKPQWTLSFKDDWQLGRTYDKLLLKKTAAGHEADADIQLIPEQGVFLSDTSWLMLTAEASPAVPENVRHWQRDEMPVDERFSLPLTVRHRRPGDRLILDEKGRRKKVSRYFIDEKVPTAKRDSSRLIADAAQNVLWILPNKKSYLSIHKEPDKIHYRLIYLRKDS